MTESVFTAFPPAARNKFEAHIDEVLGQIDPKYIGEAFRDAMAAGERQKAVHAVAEYFRRRPSLSLPMFLSREYDKAVADNGMAGKVRVINIDYAFPNGEIDFLFNPTVDNPPVNHEWLWQLNRHAWWTAMARAYADTGEETYAVAFARQLLLWVAETELVNRWNGSGSAWRTLECGLRLGKEWMIAFELFRHSAHVPDEVLLVMLGSMHRQAVHLKEHPTSCNWLIMESSGAFTYASLFPEMIDAKSIRNTAFERIFAELQLQILPDGFHFELSPDYHMTALTSALNVYSVARATGMDLPKDFTELMRKLALCYVEASTPAFTQPRTNDCYTMHTSLATELAESIFPEEKSFAFVNSLRTRGTAPEGKTASRFFPYAGFAVMRSDWTENAAYLCFDIGPLGMGHMHQDKLNIELYKGTEELIFDDGGGQYEISAARTYGISAYDHNTVTVDGMAQNRQEPKRVSEPIDAGWVTEEAYDYACGTYEDAFGDGTAYPAIHRREVRFCKPRFFVVRDTLTSRDGAPHTYEVRFHLDTLKTEKVPSIAGGILATYGKTQDLLIVPLSDEGEESEPMYAVSGQTEPCYLGWYIGRNESANHPATTLLWKSAPAKLHHFTTLLIPVGHGEALPSVRTKANGTVTVEYAEETYCLDRNSLDR